MNVVKRLLARDDVDQVVNACDAGREGELIFAYLYEKSGSRKPVQRLWLNSMTTHAIEAAFGELRPGADLQTLAGCRPLALGGRLDRGHERHPGGDDPPALLVRRRGFAGARPDADAGHPGPPRGGDPRVQARALLGGRRHVRHRSGTRRATTRAASTPAPTRGIATAEEAAAIVADCRAQTGEITKLRRPSARSARRCSMTSRRCRRDANEPLRLHGAADAGGGPAALRGAQGAHLPADQLPLSSPATWSARSSRSRSSSAVTPSTRRRRSTWPGSTCSRSDESSTTPRSPITTPSFPPTPSAIPSTR